jgi:hypothetical protein
MVHRRSTTNAAPTKKSIARSRSRAARRQAFSPADAAVAPSLSRARQENGPGWSPRRQAAARDGHGCPGPARPGGTGPARPGGTGPARPGGTGPGARRSRELIKAALGGADPSPSECQRADLLGHRKGSDRLGWIRISGTRCSARPPRARAALPSRALPSQSESGGRSQGSGPRRTVRNRGRGLTPARTGAPRQHPTYGGPGPLPKSNPLALRAAPRRVRFFSRASARGFSHWCILRCVVGVHTEPDTLLLDADHAVRGFPGCVESNRIPAAV